MASHKNRAVNRREFLQRAAFGAAAPGALPKAFPQSGQSGGGRKLGVALCGLGSYSTGQLGHALRETQYCELRGVVTGDSEKVNAERLQPAGSPNGPHRPLHNRRQ